MATGGTMVLWGPLELYNVLTKMFDQEIVWDETGTDAISFMYKIRVTGFIHGMAAANLGVLPTTGDNDAGNSYAQIRYLLGTRQHFEYRVGVTFNSVGGYAGGVVLLQADPANVAGSTNVNLLDTNNGPRAKVLSITGISSDTAIRIEVEFEISTLQCLPSGQTPNNFGVLNNRWSVVDDIDRNFMTTRTFTGRLRASSSQVNVNAFRYLCVPPLQPGMRRERMNFAATEDGLNLLYSVTDKEVAFSPPKPATTWRASFGEEGNYGTSEIGVYSHADITLGGDRYVDKQKLIAIACSMAEAKFQRGVRLDIKSDDSFFVQHIHVVDEYTDDASFIHVRATARRTDPGDPGILGLSSKFLGKPLDGKIEDVVPGYDSKFSRDGRPGDTIELTGPISIVGAFTAYLQSPCTNNFSISQGLQGQPKGVVQPQGLPQVTAVVNQGITDDGTLSTVSSADNQSTYETWHMESHDTVDMGRVQTPVATTGTGQSSGQFSLGDTWDGGQPPAGVQGAVVGSLHNPIVTKDVTAIGARVGAPPSMPKPQDLTTPDGQKWKVTGVKTSVANPKQTADGKWVHRVEMSISYAALFVATGGTSYFFFGLNPWSTTTIYKIGNAPAAPYQPGVDLNKLTIPYNF